MAIRKMITHLHPFSYSLPASADNNANFVLRFYLEADTPGDKGYVDNVLIEGIPINMKDFLFPEEQEPC